MSHPAQQIRTFVITSTDCEYWTVQSADTQTILGNFGMDWMGGDRVCSTANASWGYEKARYEQWKANCDRLKVIDKLLDADEEAADETEDWSM